MRRGKKEKDVDAAQEHSKGHSQDAYNSRLKERDCAQCGGFGAWTFIVDIAW